MTDAMDITGEAMRQLVASAAEVRQLGIPADGVVMQAIAMGFGTRRELRDALGFGYDVIEKSLERLAGDITCKTEGTIERFSPAARAPKPKVKDRAHPEAQGRSAEVDDSKEELSSDDVAVKPPCGCGRAGNHVGRCAYRRQLAASRNGRDASTMLKTVAARQPESAEAVALSQTQATIHAASRQAVDGVLRLNISVTLGVADMARWKPYDLTRFFDALATVQELGANRNQKQ